MNFGGEVVGIVSATAAAEAFYAYTGALPQNVNWASKADNVRSLIKLPENGEKVDSREEAISIARAAVCQVRSHFD